MFGLLPPGTLEFLLFAVVVGAALLILRAVSRRHLPPAGAVESEEQVPALATQHRVTGTLNKVIFDRVQSVWLAEVVVGKRRLTFCATDHACEQERYKTQIGKSVDIAVYGLATLAPGGAEAMQEQIKDLDKVDLSRNPVRLVKAGQFLNDYVVIGRVLSHRDDTLTDGTPLRVYRCEVVRTDDLGLIMELAVPREEYETATPFADQSMIHGSARLFGNFASTA
ncbi:MAG: hypothetical protein V4671_25435 [Armatimonadota bacterium]